MVRKKTSRKTPGTIRFAMMGLFIALLVALFILFRIYKTLFIPSVDVSGNSERYLYIRTGWGFDEVLRSLRDQDLLKDEKGFIWLAGKKNYASNIHPGRYRIGKNMTNNELLNKLRAGLQDPLMVTFNNIRTLEELAAVIGKQLEPDSADLIRAFYDATKLKELNHTPETLPALFIPDSYEFYWNTRPDKFIDRMKAEYISFWSKDRYERAEAIGLSPLEVSILASIVDQETLYNDENRRIAGVFMNRLRAGIPLQSDPTILFANRDFTARRVVNKHKEIDSPYNTYTHRGLPPGPICIPSISAIDGVLNFEKHDFLYFCAKDDFSGYHNFAATLSKHNENARLYQRALNKRKIFN